MTQYQLEKELERMNSALFSLTRAEFSPQEWSKLHDDLFEFRDELKESWFEKKSEKNKLNEDFFELRNRFFEEKKECLESTSSRYHRRFMGELANLKYIPWVDWIAGNISFGILKQTAKDMKAAGRALNDLSSEFSSVKGKMLSEHKQEVFEEISVVRDSFQLFWDEYKKKNDEIFDEKRAKSERVKQRIENNLEKNITRINKASTALDKMNQNREDLIGKISEAWNDDYRETAEGWLDSLEDKIADVTAQIEKYEEWISEDQEKLNNWND